MQLWRRSIDAVLRKTRKFYSREISWALVPADDPDQAFASLRDQGMRIEEIEIPARAENDVSDVAPVLSWPKSVEFISRSLPGPPIRVVVISDTHSQHKLMPLVRAAQFFFDCSVLTAFVDHSLTQAVSFIL